MGNGSGVSRGDRNRNARLDRLRVLVPVTNAIVGIDLADAKQMVVVCDHDSKVLARRTFRCRAWDLGAALDWARRPRESERLRRCDGVMRADWSPLAGPRAARHAAWDVVRVRAADADLVGAAQRGPDVRQDR
jgi:non-ribosomal peptide synthetase component F